MQFWNLCLLLVGTLEFTTAFQPSDFHYWYLQSSIVVDDWLYIVAGDLIDDDAILKFMPNTYSIDLTKSWTTSNVDPVSISIFDLVTNVKLPQLWYNPVENSVHMSGGLTFNRSDIPGSYTFTPTGSGGVVWGEDALPSSNTGTLNGLWGTAYASSPAAFYSIGGVTTLDGVQTPVMSSVVNDFRSSTWVNDTNGNGFNTRLTFDSKMEYVPNFGDEGVLVALGGNIYQDQSLRDQENPTLADFSSVDVFDINSNTWYSQATQGEVPPVAYDGCTVGVASEDGGSFEIFMFGGATNDSYDDENWNAEEYRDIYILSLPAFSWIRAQQPSEIRRRALTCQVIGNRQMLLIGGSFFANSNKARVDPWPNGMAIFDMTNLTWTDGNYDSTAGNYSRAAIVQDLYQKDDAAPTWSDPALATVFPFRQALTTQANGTNTTVSHPTGNPTATNAPTPEPTSKSSSHTNHVGAIAGGVIGGLAAIGLVIVGVYFYRRRGKRSAERSQADKMEQPSEAWHTQAADNKDYENPKSAVPSELYGTHSTAAEMPEGERSFLREKEAVVGRRSLYEMEGNEKARDRVELQ